MTEHERAEKWAGSIHSRIGGHRYDTLFREASFAFDEMAGVDKNDDSLFGYFLCGYLLGPPGVVFCRSSELNNPLPFYTGEDKERATECYQLGIQSRLEIL